MGGCSGQVRRGARLRHRHLPPTARVELIDPDRDGTPFGPFRASLDLLGDGSVQLLSTPGHTRGHLSLLLRSPDGGDVLLAGDAAYTLRNIGEGLLPMLTDDEGSSRDSLRQLKRFCDENPAAIVVPSHDPDAWRALASTPWVSAGT